MSILKARPLVSLLSCLVLAALAPLGCSDDSNDGGGGGGGGSFDSGADEGASLSSLDEGERQAVCDSLESYLGETITDEVYKRYVCYNLIVVQNLGPGGTPGDPAMCAASFEACLSEDIPIGPGFTASCDTASLGTCNATVAEYEACFGGRAENIVSYSEEASCSADPAALAQTYGVPASCQPLMTQCPALFESAPSCDSCANPSLCGDDGALYCNTCELDEAGVAEAADPASCDPASNNENNNPTCEETCISPTFCGDDGVLYCSEEAALCNGTIENLDPEACGLGEQYRFVLIEDLSTDGLGSSAPGADIDAIGVDTDGDLVVDFWASSFEDFNIGGGPNNEFVDLESLLGAPDSNCEAQRFTALGGASDDSYVIVGFSIAEEDVTFGSGAIIQVWELGPTNCPNQTTWTDDATRISVSISVDRSSFVDIGTVGDGTNAVVIP